MGFFEKIREGLKKTIESIGASLNGLGASFRRVDEDFLDELLELLIAADVGYETSQKIIDELRDLAKKEKIETPEELKAALERLLTEKMTGQNELKLSTHPSVILVVGVNGVGKTTTIGKLAHRFVEEGRQTLICAADTFRAAAADQLEIWAKRAGVDIVRQQDGADPAAVIFDAAHAAKARGADILICDTAGRLHNKKNLMDELAKMLRVLDRELPDADREVLLVLDATTGQNAVQQAKDFNSVVGVTGAVLTKLDGTAKGGVTVAVRDVTGIPVKFIGVGEKMDDLQAFEPQAFAKALLEG